MQNCHCKITFWILGFSKILNQPIHTPLVRLHSNPLLHLHRPSTHLEYCGQVVSCSDELHAGSSRLYTIPLLRMVSPSASESLDRPRATTITPPDEFSCLSPFSIISKFELRILKRTNKLHTCDSDFSSRACSKLSRRTFSKGNLSIYSVYLQSFTFWLSRVTSTTNVTSKHIDAPLADSWTN